MPEATPGKDIVIQTEAPEKIIQTLKEKEIYGKTDKTFDKFLDRFAQLVGGGEKRPDGFNLAWETCTDEIYSDYPPVLKATVAFKFNSIIDATISDPQEVSEIKKVRQEFLEYLREKQK